MAGEGGYVAFVRLRPHNGNGPSQDVIMNTARPRILLVDDDESVRRLMGRELRHAFDVVTADGPDDAIDIVQRGAPFQAVLSDYMMGPTNGVALLETVRRRRPAAARILVTGSICVPEVDAAAASGAIHRVITKPWPPGSLCMAVRAVISSLDQSPLV